MRHAFLITAVGLAGAAAVSASGCATAEHGGGTASAPHVAAPVSHHHPPVTPRPIVLHDQLFAVERRWPGIATSDRLAVDRHGFARIVHGGGGGGLRIEHCTFGAREMAGWRRDLARLGPRRPTATSPERWPSTYLIDYAGRQRVVQSGAMPRRYRPFARRVVRVLFHPGNGCHTIYAQRRH